MRAWMNPENDDVITSTGGVPCWSRPNGNASCGNHKSHWTCEPGSCTSLSAGSGGRYYGRKRATFSRNTDDAPDQPTRSASAVAGIRGDAANNTRTCAANGSKLEATGGR